MKFKPLQKVGAIIGALKSGQIDAWSIVPHIAKGLGGAGAVQIIGDVADYIPNYQVTTVFTSADRAANDRATTEAFLKAFGAGVDDFNAALVDKTAGDGEEALERAPGRGAESDEQHPAAVEILGQSDDLQHLGAPPRREADRKGGDCCGAVSRPLPFAGMTRIRFQGSRPQPPLSRFLRLPQRLRSGLNSRHRLCQTAKGGRKGFQGSRIPRTKTRDLRQAICFPGI